MATPTSCTHIAPNTPRRAGLGRGEEQLRLFPPPKKKHAWKDLTKIRVGRLRAGAPALGRPGSFWARKTRKKSSLKK